MNIYTESAPDWRAWRDLRTIRLIDAVVLSLGICPNWLNHTNQTNPTHPVFNLIEGELMRRVQVSINRAGEFDGWTAIYPEHQRIEAKISIADYVNWAISVMNWEVPQDMAALANTNKAQNGLTIPQAAATTPPLATTGNKLKTKEAHPLRSHIDIAKDKAIEPKRDIDVWNQLAALAQEKPPKPPLIGFVEGEGIKYQDAKGVVRFYKLKTLRDQLRRDKDTRANAP